jgi:N-acetylglucosaminyldiphosphoundecaprenol N-acetyl-beta-D-mannosaminyltransferase
MVNENILTLPISVGSYQKFVDEIFNLASHENSSYVCFANVHMTIEAYKDNDFKNVVKNADLVAPDGQPLSLFLRYLKNINQERVCGMDIFPDLLREAQARGKSVYFYGSTNVILNKILNKAKKEFPELIISGVYSPPFRPISSTENDAIIATLNNARPDLIFVSLGCPKQEKWMAEHKDKIHGCMLGVGQAFNVYAGESKRSPSWMQRMALEWAYRLYLEPRRLWKRYFYTNSLFLILTSMYIMNTGYKNLVQGFKTKPISTQAPKP